eukprot:747450-Hanusia_phi.AAC.2
MIECTCDVNSSLAASAIVKVVKSACKAIVCDLVVLLEGQAEDELPERVRKAGQNSRFRALIRTATYSKCTMLT